MKISTLKTQNIFLALILFLVPLFFWFVPELYVQPKILIFNILLLLWSLFLMIKKTPHKFCFSKFDLFLIIFIFYEIISLFWAVNYYLGIEYLSMQILCLIFYLFVKNSPSLNKKDQFIFSAVIYSSFLICSYAFLQILGYDFLSKPEEYSALILCTFGKKNFLGQYLVLSIIAHIYLFSYPLVFKKRIFVIISLLMNIFILMYTLSKTVLVTFFIFLIFLLFFLIFLFKKEILQFKKTIFKYISIFISSILILYFVSALIPFKVNYDQYYLSFGYAAIGNKHFDKRQNFQSAINNNFLMVYYRMSELKNLKSENIRIRFLLIKNTLPMIKDHLFFGVGLKNWEVYHQKYQDAEEKKIIDHVRGQGGIAFHAHNDYIEFLSELGIVGISLAFVFFVFFFKKSYQYIFQPENKIQQFRKILIFMGIVLIFIQSISAFPLHLIVPMIFLSFFTGMIFYKDNDWVILKEKTLLLFKIIVLFILLVILNFNIKYFKRDYYSAYIDQIASSTFEAIEYYQKILDVTPYDYRAHFRLAGLYSEMSQAALAHQDWNIMPQYSMRAIQHYQKSLEYQPFFFRAYYNIGNVYLNLGDTFKEHQEQNYSNAVKNYLKAIELSPEYASAYINLGNIYAQMGLKHIHDPKSPTDPEPYFLKALEFHKKAFEHYQKEYIATRGNMIYKSLGIDYHYLGDFESAIENFRKYLEYLDEEKDSLEIQEIKKVIREDSLLMVK